jgi:hypothetical protein
MLPLQQLTSAEAYVGERVGFPALGTAARVALSQVRLLRASLLSNLHFLRPLPADSEDAIRQAERRAIDETFASRPRRGGARGSEGGAAPPLELAYGPGDLVEARPLMGNAQACWAPARVLGVLAAAVSANADQPGSSSAHGELSVTHLQVVAETDPGQPPPMVETVPDFRPLEQEESRGRKPGAPAVPSAAAGQVATAPQRSAPPSGESEIYDSPEEEFEPDQFLHELGRLEVNPEEPTAPSVPSAPSAPSAPPSPPPTPELATPVASTRSRISGKFHVPCHACKEDMWGEPITKARWRGTLCWVHARCVASTDSPPSSQPAPGPATPLTHLVPRLGPLPPRAAPSVRGPSLRHPQFRGPLRQSLSVRLS